MKLVTRVRPSNSASVVIDRRRTRDARGSRKRHLGRRSRSWLHSVGAPNVPFSGGTLTYHARRERIMAAPR
jgi:hypothetical protein